ncbi:hypothetical protein DDE82_009124 [Stemphylium lycopersici]|nr:hypothetical protein TW65_03245 [Stemphylium lycopersici]RAQ98574.1 hypothetical protein DDE82_009124 [Stemphylium lycopersici]
MKEANAQTLMSLQIPAGQRLHRNSGNVQQRPVEPSTDKLERPVY